MLCILCVTFPSFLKSTWISENVLKESLFSKQCLRSPEQQFSLTSLIQFNLDLLILKTESNIFWTFSSCCKCFYHLALEFQGRSTEKKSTFLDCLFGEVSFFPFKNMHDVFWENTLCRTPVLKVIQKSTKYSPCPPGKLCLWFLTSSSNQVRCLNIASHHISGPKYISNIIQKLCRSRIKEKLCE